MSSIFNSSERKQSNSMRAVLCVVTADNELKRKTLRHIDIDGESIDWESVWSNDFGGGHSAALLFAQALWCDCVVTKSDPFDRAFAMSPHLQNACLSALAIRWGITK